METAEDQPRDFSCTRACVGVPCSIPHYMHRQATNQGSHSRKKLDMPTYAHATRQHLHHPANRRHPPWGWVPRAGPQHAGQRCTTTPPTSFSVGARTRSPTAPPQNFLTHAHARAAQQARWRPPGLGQALQELVHGHRLAGCNLRVAPAAAGPAVAAAAVAVAAAGARPCAALLAAAL